jgi:hypothetical protein
MVGLAARPGTDVEPVCSIRSARSGKMEVILSASRAYSPGQAGS